MILKKINNTQKRKIVHWHLELLETSGYHYYDQGLFAFGFYTDGYHSHLRQLGILAGYVFMNIAYSFYLKHIAIIDVTIIAIGFVLRLFVGSVANRYSSFHVDCYYDFFTCSLHGTGKTKR